MRESLCTVHLQGVPHCRSPQSWCGCGIDWEVRGLGPHSWSTDPQSSDSDHKITLLIDQSVTTKHVVQLHVYSSLVGRII